MANFTVRNVPEPVHAAITQRAKKHNRSTEAEIRAILAAVAAGEVGRGLGQTLRACWKDALGDDFSDVRDLRPLDGTYSDSEQQNRR